MEFFDSDNEESANDKELILLSRGSDSASVEISICNGLDDENTLSENELETSLSENATEASEELENTVFENPISLEDTADAEEERLQQPLSGELQADESNAATGEASTESMDERGSESAAFRKITTEERTYSISSDSSVSNKSGAENSKVVAENSKNSPISIKIPLKALSSPKRVSHGVQTRKRQVSELRNLNIMATDIENLCLLDENSYYDALEKDSLKFYRNKIFPISIPWHNTNAELPANVSRDIDDLDGVFFADDENDEEMFPLFSLVDDKNPRLSSFEFTKKKQFLDRKSLLWLGYDDAECSSASVRRSDDIGVIELIVSLPSLPPNENSEDIDDFSSLSGKTKSLFTRRAEVMSHFPWNWNCKFDSSTAQNDRQMFMKLLKNFEGSYDDVPCATNASDLPACDDLNIKEKVEVCFSRAKERKEFISNLRKKTHKWNISVKVGGVSSRSKLFPFNDGNLNGKASASNPYSNRDIVDGQPQSSGSNRKRRFDAIASRVETRTAILPASVQTGRCVSLETAVASCSNEKLKSILANDQGNTNESSSNKKKNNIDRTKRVFIGRTRLIWTRKMVNNTEDGYCLFNKNYANLIANGQLKKNIISTALDTDYDDNSAMLKGNSNKVVYTSLLNGQKLDSNSSRRCREVTVAIKVNNHMMSAKDISNGSFNALRKENNVQIHDNTKLACIEDKGYDISMYPNPFNAVCVLNRTIFFESLSKEAKNPRKNQSFQHSIQISSDDPILTDSNFADSITNMTDPQPLALVAHKSRFVMKVTSPRLGCISLDDGPLRTVCYSSGIVKGASPLAVHLMLNQAANIDTKRLCTVCWTKCNEIVHECCDCGLLTHLNCCKNQGNLFDDKTKWRCAVCHDYYSSMNPSQLSSVLISAEKRIFKPMRRTRLPSRFSSDADVVVTNTTTVKDDENLSKKMQHWEKCVAKHCNLCPYSGGAMSPAPDPDACGGSKQWVHEICRIWCSSGKRKNTSMYKTTINTSNICVLCGNEGTKTNSGDKKEKKSSQKSSDKTSSNKENKQVDEIADSSKVAKDPSTKYANQVGRSNLVKCAANGCSIRFHPFCAVMTTKCGEAELLQQSNIDNQCHRSSGSLSSANLSSMRSLRNNDDTIDEEVTKQLKEMASEDKELTRQYTLQVLEISRKEGSFGCCFEGTKKSSIVPIAFCGLHNPKRVRSLFGCPLMTSPALSSAMHIPNFPEQGEEMKNR